MKDEYLNKLSRLSRLEYKVAEMEIENSHSDFISWLFTWAKYYLVICLFAIAFSYSTSPNVQEVGSLFIKLSQIITLVCFLGAIIDIILKKIEYNKLNDQYFDFQIKSKEEVKHGKANRRSKS